MHGEKLLEEITEATGLPPHLITNELQELIQKKGLSFENISLEDIRNILTEYLQRIILEAKQELQSSGFE